MSKLEKELREKHPNWSDDSIELCIGLDNKNKGWEWIELGLKRKCLGCGEELGGHSSMMECLDGGRFEEE